MPVLGADTDYDGTGTELTYFCILYEIKRLKDSAQDSNWTLFCIG